MPAARKKTKPREEYPIPRHPYSRMRVSTVNEEPPMTKQSFKDECDVNHIVARYTETGMVPVSQKGEPQYGEAPEVDAFEGACIAADVASHMEYESIFSQAAPEAAGEELSENPAEGTEPAPKSATEALKPSEPSTDATPDGDGIESN